MFGITSIAEALVCAGVFIFGIVWCKQVFKRFRSDLAELKAADYWFDRAGILFIWFITLCIILFMVIVTWFGCYVVADLI